MIRTFLFVFLVNFLFSHNVDDWHHHVDPTPCYQVSQTYEAKSCCWPNPAHTTDPLPRRTFYERKNVKCNKRREVCLKWDCGEEEYKCCGEHSSRCGYTQEVDLHYYDPESSYCHVENNVRTIRCNPDYEEVKNYRYVPEHDFYNDPLIGILRYHYHKCHKDCPALNYCNKNGLCQYNGPYLDRTCDCNGEFYGDQCQHCNETYVSWNPYMIDCCKPGFEHRKNDDDGLDCKPVCACKKEGNSDDLFSNGQGACGYNFHENKRKGNCTDVLGTGTCECVCTNYWEGEDCSYCNRTKYFGTNCDSILIPCDPESPSTCNGDKGVCHELNSNTNVCVCTDPNYGGQLCDEPKCFGKLDIDACNNENGICKFVTGGTECECTDSTKWSGEECEDIVCNGNTELEGTCSGHGSCDHDFSTGENTCFCEEFYLGDDCETPVCGNVTNAEGACGGINHGICRSTSPPTCECLYPWIGEECEENSLFSESPCYIGFLDYYNAHTSRFVCKGNGPNCNNDTNLLAMDFSTSLIEGKTIRDFCYNKHYGIAITSDYQLWVNDFEGHSGPENVFVKVNQDFEGRPKKVSCTDNSVFMLTFAFRLYQFGRSTYGEITLTPSLPTTVNFIFFEDYMVKNIETSDKTIYIVLLEDGNNVKEVLWRGSNNLGGQAFGSMDLSSVDTQMTDYPKVQPMEDGVLFTYSLIVNDGVFVKHYFQGRYHPTTKDDESILADLVLEDPDQLLQKHPIDYMDRIKGGCGIIISEDTLYGWGNCSSETTGFSSPSEVMLMSTTQVHDFDGKLVIDFICSTSCYILTEEKVFIVGPTTNGAVDLFTTNLMFIIPQVGGDTFYGIEKSDKFSVHHDLIVNEFQPYVSDFHLAGGNLFLEIVKSHTFKQHLPNIKIGLVYGVDDDYCIFQSKDQIWEFESLEITPVGFEPDTYDVYRHEGSWGNQVEFCGWQVREGENDLAGFKIYSNKVFFEELFFIKYIRSTMFCDSEDYYLDLEVLFESEIIIEIEINVKRKPFPVELVIYEKRIDEGLMYGELKFLMTTDSPNLMNLTGFSLTNPENFKTDTFTIIEEESKRVCDLLNCFQYFYAEFKYDNCTIETDVNLNFNHYCSETPSESEIQAKCDTNVTHDFNPTVTIMTEDLCGIAQIKIDVEGTVEVYRDWEFLEKYLEIDEDGVYDPTDPEPMMMDDYAYFHFDLDVIDDAITMVSSSITKVVFNNFILYEDGGKTAEGEIADFNMMTHVDVDKNRMYFKITPDHVNLGFGETTSTAPIVSVTIDIHFLGNERRTILGNFKMDKNLRRFMTAFDVQRLGDSSTTAVIITVLSLTAGLVVLVSLVVFCFVGYFCIKDHKKKKDYRKVELL